jgi:ubiquinone/menaquinone biosynthesis C-methylase UbiE
VSSLGATEQPTDEVTTAGQIAHNIAVHDRLARKYDARHGEIFNDVEQLRLRAALRRACASVRSGSKRIQALDFGCGSGNLTGRLLELGTEVTAADVSEAFLALVRSRYPTDRLKTLRLNGRDLGSLDDNQFDLVATYSVLHHIPDYLAAVSEMARVCKPGGLVLIDHEPNESYWHGDPIYDVFRAKALRVDWRKFLRPSNYIHRIKRIFDPRHAAEGDIHVWPDDHIEWSMIKAKMSDARFEVAIEDDYLLYRALYRREVYDEYAGQCADTKMMAFRKPAG